jgi:polyferredoxin
MNEINPSLSLTESSKRPLNTLQNIGLLIGFSGIAIITFSLFSLYQNYSEILLYSSLGAISLGVILYTIGTYIGKTPGIKNDYNWLSGLTNRGTTAWIAGIFITTFYVLLYWYPQLLGLGVNGQSNSGLIGFFDPLSQLLKGPEKFASEWFVYGTLYTLAILVFGIKFIAKYKHNRYQVIRTISVMFFQLGFAFIIPAILEAMSLPYNDFKNVWPLNYYFFDTWNINGYLNAGNIGLFMLIFGVAMILLVTPILTYFFGKRWYCSWVCGCGGLAETAGDPFRHLSDKSVKAWKIERWSIHLVLVLAFIMTIAVIYNYRAQEVRYLVTTESFLIGFTILMLSLAGITFYNRDKWINKHNRIAFIIGACLLGLVFLCIGLSYFTFGSNDLFFIQTYKIQQFYGFFIGAAFSGVVGVGFYPIMGSRVWCRFGCPMAGLLGLQQKFFSRFRITTNGSQCISCGNCSTYCEMGIDVRAYAEKGQDIVRASCVGCGICSAVCPRGVLKLENGPMIDQRASEKRAFFIAEDEIKML